MSQMVLPQTPAPSAQPDNGGNKPAAGNDKSGDSAFDSVSRAEQKRLDRKQAESRDRAKSNEQARRQPDERAGRAADGNARADNARAGRKEDTKAGNPAETSKVPASADERQLAEGAEGAEGAEVKAELPEELTALTFVDLQAMMAPTPAPGGLAAGGSASGSTSGSAAVALPGTGGQAPGLQGLASGLAGLPGMKGIMAGNAADAGGKGSGQTAGFQFAEALTAVSSESGRAQDSTSLLAAGRVQTLADVSGQQLANATAKLPAEATGLRGYATSVDVPVGHAEWGDKLVGKLAWLTANKLSVAEIHLTPPDMGPMEVRVQVQQEHANITVHAANPAVRDQLELHSHRLRDMLSEHGLSLEQFDVADSPQQQTDDQDAGGEGGNPDSSSESDLASAAADELDAASGSLDLSWKGEVDIFA